MGGRGSKKCGRTVSDRKAVPEEGGVKEPLEGGVLSGFTRDESLSLFVGREGALEPTWPLRRCCSAGGKRTMCKQPASNGTDS